MTEYAKRMEESQKTWLAQFAADLWPYLGPPMQVTPVEAKSSYELSSPTASQRGDGKPGFSVKKYYAAEIEGAAEAAMAAVMRDYQTLLDFRPVTKP